MSTDFTSLLPFLAALKRKPSVPSGQDPSGQDQDEDESNPPPDQSDGSMFTSLLPFLAVLKRQESVPSDDDDSNAPADQFDGSSTAAWADPAAARGNGGQQNASGQPSPSNASSQPNPSTPRGAGTSNAQGRPPRLYAVLYTQGNRGEGGDQDFKNAAFTRADDISHSPDFDPQKDNVWVYAVQTKDDFKNVVENLGNYEKQYGKVEQLALFSHGGREKGPIFHKPDQQGKWGLDQFEPDEFSHLKINFSPTATADLMMCHTAENGYAQAFATEQGVPTRGFGDTVFSSDPVKKVRGYGQGGREYMLGSGGNWFQRNVMGYPPQPPHVFLPGLGEP